MGLTCMVLCLFVCFLPFGERSNVSPSLTELCWTNIQRRIRRWAITLLLSLSHLLIPLLLYLQKVFKFQSHHFSQRKYDEMVFELTGDSKIWWTTIPYGISLSLPSTSMIKEGNTRELFSASLVVVTESMMNATWTVFTTPKLPSWYDFDCNLESSAYWCLKSLQRGWDFPCYAEGPCIVAVSSLSHVWLWNLMDYSRPGFPVLQHLLSLLWLMSFESVKPSNRLIFKLYFST